MSIRTSISVLVFVGLPILIAGCDTKKVTDAVSSTVDKAKSTVNKTVEAAKQEVNLAGSMELSTNPPVAAKACYAKLIITGGERPNVLQLASYKDTEFERFPAMLVQAPVSAASASELAGQTVQASVFAQADEKGAVWRTRAGAPAAIVVSAADAKSLTCQCSGVTLVNDATGEEASVSGKFVALLE